MKYGHIIVAIVAVISWIDAGPADATLVYDAAADFSATNNPSGVWSYGWSSTLGSAFSLYPQTTVLSGLDFWIDPSIESAFAPSVAHNPTTSTIDISGVAFWLPGQLTFHPGQSGEYSIVRWTAPASMSIVVDVSFEGRDIVPTTTDVHVLHNNSSLFDGDVNAFGTGPSFSAMMAIEAGDTIDFAVGIGGDFFNDDTTGLNAKITQAAIPEAAPLLIWSALAGIGLSSVVIGRWRQLTNCRGS